MNFNKRLFIWLTLTFVLATVAGTLTHEGGHYIVAKCFGYNAKINYMSTSYSNPESAAFMDSITDKYKTQILADKHFDFPQKEKFLKISKGNYKSGFWIILGGPLETMLTGSLGLFFLYLNRKSFSNVLALSVKQWFFVFISLFWLRQTANLVVWVGSYLIKGEFSQRGDEIKLAHHFELPEWTIVTFTALIGAGVLALIIFRFVPAKQRITFIASGMVGGITGYIFWLELFGKLILP